jgi:methyl-accepting chemotaxis protein
MKQLAALRTVLSAPYLARSVLVMTLVGTVLNLINQGDALFNGAPFDITKLLLTYAVPFCVSTYSAWATFLAFHAEPATVGRDRQQPLLEE